MNFQNNNNKQKVYLSTLTQNLQIVILQARNIVNKNYAIVTQDLISLRYTPKILCKNTMLSVTMLHCSHAFELLSLVYTTVIVRVVNSRRMRWAGHVGEDRGVHRVLVGKPEGKSHWGDQDVDGRIILRWIFRNLEGVVWTGWSWLRIGTGGRYLWVR